MGWRWTKIGWLTCEWSSLSEHKHTCTDIDNLCIGCWARADRIDSCQFDVIIATVFDVIFEHHAFVQCVWPMNTLLIHLVRFVTWIVNDSECGHITVRLIVICPSHSDFVRSGRGCCGRLGWFGRHCNAHRKQGKMPSEERTITCVSIWTASHSDWPPVRPPPCLCISTPVFVSMCVCICTPVSEWILLCHSVFVPTYPRSCVRAHV